MATYNLTPSERRARAQALKEQRENRRLYSQYLEAQKAAEIERESAWLQQKKEESEKNNQNFFTRAFSTIGDLAANVLTGAVKGLEGIYDLGAGIVGAVGGIFDKDFQDSVKQHIAYDWTSETIGNPLQEALKYSYLKDGGIIENIASGIGQMLPAVAVSVATGGLGAPAAMAQTASLLTLGASAAGNSTEEAFKDGAGYYQGLGYGLASGAVEIATEKMFGGATKALTGAGLLDGVTRSVADVGIKRIAKNALEEGVEEIVSELANPLLKSIYKGKDALSEYGSADYWKGVGQAGIVGSLTALAYSGTVGYGLSKVGVGYVGKEADIADSLSEISSLKEKGTNLQAEGRLDAKNEAKIADTVKRNYQNIESVLKKTSAEKRVKLIEKFSLDKAFNPEGTMSEQLSSWLSETPSAEQTSAEGGEKPTSELASPKKDYYSFTLRGSEQVIQEDLQKMTEDRRRAYAEQNGVTVEEAAKKVADIKVYDGEMSEQAQEHFSKMKKAINALNKMSGGNLSFVITEANDVFNGTIVDDRTVYMGVDAFESDTWAGTLVHEYTHFSEGSQEYDKLFKYLVSDDIQIDDGNGGKVKLWQKAQESVLAQNYGFTEDALQQIIKKAETGEMLTEQETRYYNAFKSEVGARMSEYLLGNEAFIDKIVAKDSSLARKFITKIHDLMSAFKRVGRDAKVEMRQLKKAESLYLAAARKAGNQALVRKILKARKERGESVDVDSSTEVQYNRKESLIGKTFPTYNESQGGDANTLATRWAHRADIIAGDQTLVSFHDAWYMVEKFDDSDSGYQIVGEITENDYNRIAEDIKRNGASGRIQSIQRAFTDYAQFDKRRDSARREESSPRGVQTEHGGEDTKVLQVDRDESQRGQTQSDGNGDSKGRRKSKRGVKYSLKDSEGKTLSEGQQKYFADSKVRDSEGNLLVVYHGTMSGDFTVFDASYSNVESDMGAGFYFSSSYEDVNSNYEEGGQDLEAKIERLAEKIEAEEEIDYYEAKEKAKNRLSKKSKLFEVYLDIKNPAYVGGNIDSQTTLFRDLYDDIELNMEDFDSEDDYYEALYSEQDDAIREFADKVNDMLESKGISGYEEWFEILANDGAFEGASISQVKEALNGSLYDCYDANGDYAVNEVVRTIIEALGYDGIIDNSVVDKWGYNSGRTHYMQGLDEETRHYIVFKPEQIKLTSNTNPTTNEDIRWSLKNDPMERRYSAELSDGQVKKLLANNTKLKVYTKAEAESIVNNIISNYLDFGEKYGVISGKTRKQAVEMLWRGLNTADPGRQMKVALDIAEYIIQNSVMESVYDDAESETHIYTISLLKPYLHSIDLSRIKGEIKYRYGNDNSVYLLWGKRKGTKGYGADQIAQILEEQGMRIDAINDADIFFEIDSAYRAAVAALKSKAKTLLSSAMSSTERKALKQQIAREVLLGFDEKGKASKLSKIIDIYREKANVWKKAYYEERSKNKLLNRILDKVQKLKDIKLGTFLNASQFKSDIFKGSIEKLANIKYRGNLNEAGTRKIITNLSEWYVKENPMLEGVYEDEVADMLRSISEGEGKLDADELKTLEKVVDYFKHFIETYNKVYRNGEFVDAQPIAENYVRIIQENKGVKVGWFAKLTAMRYFKTFADPMTVARRMDMYEGGFYTEMLERLREGAVGASIMEMEMREPLEEFYKKNKKFLKELAKKTVKYQGQDIPLSQAMLLYMTLNREQALKGLAESGFTYTVDKETVRLKGFAVGEELTLEELKQRAKAVQDELSKQFSELDKEYISIAEKLFNETCKQAKRETDIKRKGYSNALEDYYVPIRRAFIAHNVDTSTFADEMNRVSNASFNRDTVKGAKNELYIDALDAVLDRHIWAVAQYANLSLAIDEYNKLFNLDLGDNPNKPKSVRTESVDVWREGDEYFKKLISDIQGIPVVKGEGAKFMSFIRGGYAKFQLGANPKVWVTQLSSFAAAGSILDLDSITRGLSIKTNDVDEYCKLAKLRNNDNTVALAQGVLDKVGTVGNALMIPIGKVDRFVVKRLFGACQVQVEKDSGLKIGTEENKVKAGELLKKVILETQQNAMATERSAAMRSGNELMKTLTMFTADSMKVIGRVIDSVGELSVLKSKLKATTDAKQIADLNEKIKKANKKTRKAIASLVTSAVFMALVAQLFRTLYNRDDDDDNIIVNMTVDAVGNLFGGLPIIKDIYARFTEGYDLDNYAYSAINNLFDSAEGIFNMVGNVISGDWDSKELARNAKNLLFTAGQILGLPTRNVYNIGYGLIKRFSPSTAYKIDDMFYNQKYRSDLNKAIEKDDDEMIATIVGIMLDENIGDITSSTARKELDRLVKAGYSVIPRGVGNSVTYEGEEYALTARQAKDFKAVYSTANEALASLVTLSQYSSASDDVKAKAVNFVFDTYYNLALQDFLGVEIESKNVLFAEAIDIEKLAIIVAMARALTADLDKKGNAISGTRKAKVQSYINSLKLTAAQKYMIMGYLGYTNTKGEAQVKAYINRLKLTKSEKAKLLKYSGYSK